MQWEHNIKLLFYNLMTDCVVHKHVGMLICFLNEPTFRMRSGLTCLCTNVSSATRMISAPSGWLTTPSSWRDATWAEEGRESMSRRQGRTRTHHSKDETAGRTLRTSNESKFYWTSLFIARYYSNTHFMKYLGT